jgi:hypothetical protein
MVGSCPTLTNAHDPINYGADNTGSTDSDSAINSAAAAGRDIVFGTAGTYLVNMTHAGTGIITSQGIQPAANVQIECNVFNSDGSPAVHLLTTNNSLSQNWYLTNGSNTICGCDFEGTDTTFYSSGAGNTNPNAIVINSNNDTIEGNTFHGIHGDAAINTASGPSVAPSGWLVQYNTYEHDGYYGMNTDASAGGTEQHDLSYGDTLAEEYDGCTNTAPYVNQNGIFQYNYLHYRTAPGASLTTQSYMGAWYPSTGAGASVNCNYSTDIFSDNVVDAVAGITPPAYNDIWVSNNNSLPCADRALYGTNAGGTYKNNHYVSPGGWYDSSTACSGHDAGGIVTP